MSEILLAMTDKTTQNNMQIFQKCEHHAAKGVESGSSGLHMAPPYQKMREKLDEEVSHVHPV